MDTLECHILERFDTVWFSLCQD